MSRIVTTAAGAPTALFLKLLGPFTAIDAAGRDRALPRKVQALLCFLVSSRGRAVARDDIAALLWDGTRMSQARQSLRQSMLVLRNVLPKEAAAALIADGDTLCLARSPCIQSDLETFESFSRADDRLTLAQADSLYRGPLLQGIKHWDVPFDDWLLAERQRLSLAHLRVIDRLARLSFQAGDSDDAIAYARRLVDIDRCREESSRLLMEVLAAGDERGAALIEYARLSRELRNELDVDPESETHALADHIRSGKNTNSFQVERIAERRINPSPSLDDRWHRPRVLTLPFRNLAGRRQDYDVMGAVLAEDVALALADDQLLHVEARDGPDVSRVASAMTDSVYSVCGSIRTTPQGLRAVVQLADAAGRCLWLGSFDHGEAGGPQQVPARIAARLSHAIRTIEIERSRDKPVDALGIAQLCLRAAAACRDGRAGNEAALAMLRKLLDRSPEIGAAHALAARCYHVQRIMGWRAPNDPRLAEGVFHARKAAALSPTDPDALWMAGLALMNIEGDLETARHLIEEAATIAPSSVNARIAGIFLHCHMGDTDAALDNAREATLLNPFDRSHHVLPSAAATAHFVAGDYAAANAACDLALAQSPGYAGALRVKIAAAGLLGRLDDAAKSARQLLAREPDASIGRARSYWRFLAPGAAAALDATAEGWRRAGMPE